MARRRISFGELLRQHRNAAGLSQAALAARTRVSPGLVALLELNQRRPRRDKVIALADALDLQGHDRQQFLVRAGYASDEAPAESPPVPRAIRELLSDERLSLGQRAAAERLLTVFAQWLRDELARGALSPRRPRGRGSSRPV